MPDTPVAPTSIPPNYGGFSKKPTPPEKEGDVVVTPHDHDVLCGRGGLTNHHPGNTWYRRLVRSNRNLYKISPKHTKLLVSKAIVHHVQSQNPSGRFLECHKTTGLWFPVPYKRAVDKTSQALRERDREGDEEDDDEDPPIQTSSGMPPNLSDLAQAAMAQSRLAHPAMVLPPHPSSKSNAVPNSTMSSEGESVPPPPGGKRPLERGASWFGFGAKRAKTEEDPIPLPTAPLQQRSSSVFRFFQTSGLFGGAQQQAPAPAMDNYQQQSGGYPNFQQGTSRQMPPSFNSSVSSQSAGPPNFNNSASHGSHVTPSFGQPMVSTGAPSFSQATSTGSQMGAPLFHSGTSTGSHLAPTFGQDISSGSHNVAPNFSQGTSSGSQMKTPHFGQASSTGSQMTAPTFGQAMSGSAAQGQGAPNFGQSSSTGPPQGFSQQGSSQGMLPNFNNGHNSGYNQGNIYPLQQQQTSQGYNAALMQPSTSYGSQQFSSQSINLSQGYQQHEMQQQQFNLQGKVAPPPPLPLNDVSTFGVAPEFEPRPLDGAGDFKQGAEAPSLTRLTTQVSDWLTSFWPLQRELSSEVLQQQMQQPQQMQQADTNHMNQQIPNGNMNLQQQDAMRQMQHLQQGGMHGMPQQQQQQLRSSTQQQPIQQQMPSAGGPQPPELSQSVSSTFFKLAASPSRLFSGLSTFFDRSQSSLHVQSGMSSNMHLGISMNAGNSMGNLGMSSTNMGNLGMSSSVMGNQVMSSNNMGSQGMSSNNMGNQVMLNGNLGRQGMTTGMNPGIAPEMGMEPPTLGRAAMGNKTTLSRSLLDDYEETAMETRLRTVPSR